MDQRINKYQRVWLIVGLLIALGHIAYSVWRASVAGHADIICFHKTSLHWWQTGQFTREFGIRHYCPAFVVLMTPLVIWPLAITAGLWATLNIILLFLSVRTSSHWASKNTNNRLPFTAFWVWPVAMVLPYASSTLTQGQVNILVLWLCLVAFNMFSRRKDLWAGGLIAVAGIIKLYPLIFILYCLAKLRLRAALSAAMIFILLAGSLSLIGFGWQGSIDAHRQWLIEVRGDVNFESATTAPAEPSELKHLIFRNRLNEFHRHNNQSLAVVIRRLTTDLYPNQPHAKEVNFMNFSPKTAFGLYTAIEGGIFITLIWIAWRRRHTDQYFVEWAGWLAGVIAFVPVYWTHYFVLVLPALTVLNVNAWHNRNMHQRNRLSQVLWFAWLSGFVMLAFHFCRNIGLHCWLTIAIMLFIQWNQKGDPASHAQKNQAGRRIRPGAA